MTVPRDGVTLESDFTRDCTLAGSCLYLQVLEDDPGATRGVSFSRGIRWSLGL
ncbi:MAG: hypothetical protein AB1486_03820 [Planctomycetota bacterium]